MHIKKIKLQASGLKGMEISFFKQDEKSGRIFPNLTTVRPQYPIHLGLENLFKELRVHLLEIAGYLHTIDADEKEYMVQDTEVLGITLDNDWFLLTGTKKVLDNGKISISTPKIDEGSGFIGFDKVQEIIGNIIVETKEYLAGTKKVSDEEMGIRYIESLLRKGQEAEKSVEEFKNMSPEEQKAFCTSFLEKKFGSIVSHYEDLEAEENAQVIELNAKTA